MYARFVYEMFLWSSCKPCWVNGILGHIDPPVRPLSNWFSDKVIDRLHSGANGIQQVDWARADYWRNNCYSSEPGSIVPDVSPGSAGTEKGRKRRINKEHKERKKEHKRKWHVRVLRWWTGAEKRWWGRCTTEGLWGGGGGEPHLTEYEWMSGCLTTTGSWLLVSNHWSQYPWIPSPRPLAPTALRVEKRGGKTRGAKESVSDKGTVCSVGKVERREVGAAAEWNRQASTPLVFSTSQSKATVCEKSILQSHSTHLSLSYKKQKTWRTSIFPKQQACQREHRERDRSEAKPKMLKSESGQLNARGDGGRGGVGG